MMNRNGSASLLSPFFFPFLSLKPEEMHGQGGGFSEELKEPHQPIAQPNSGEFPLQGKGKWSSFIFTGELEEEEEGVKANENEEPMVAPNGSPGARPPLPPWLLSIPERETNGRWTKQYYSFPASKRKRSSAETSEETIEIIDLDNEEISKEDNIEINNLEIREKTEDGLIDLNKEISAYVIDIESDSHSCDLKLDERETEMRKNDSHGSDLKMEERENKGKNEFESGGLRCSRMNGKTWRCKREALLGYALCEYHHGKARMRSINQIVSQKRGKPEKSESNREKSLKREKMVGKPEKSLKREKMVGKPEKSLKREKKKKLGELVKKKGKSQEREKSEEIKKREKLEREKNQRKKKKEKSIKSLFDETYVTITQLRF
ncbi:transcription initiation factor TFIID subunit 3-like [Amborella trichopoda]|nr:transcription initiation factor TFIID subunit 3-like [Amborella trichopoda]|eukprot:XP_020526146.1 transcription initiation factor TFIID subunit 3-like [Amborella trichopoda]